MFNPNDRWKGLLVGLLLVVMMLFMGCEQINSFIGDQAQSMTPEKALKIAEQGEVFYGKAKIGIAGYIANNPKALTDEQKLKLVASVDAFELVYKNTKDALIKIYKAKNGQKITIDDIKDDVLVLAGEYVKLKRIIKPLLGDTITYPDEMKTNTIGNEANIKIEEVIPVAAPAVAPDPTSTAEPPKTDAGSSATTPTKTLGAPST